MQVKKSLGRMQSRGDTEAFVMNDTIPGMTDASSADPYSVETVGAALSQPRLIPYLHAAGGDATVALRLYEWGARMSSAAFEVVAHVEVVLRNAIDHALTVYFGDAGRGIPWFLLGETPLNSEVARRIEEVRGRLRRQGQDTRAQVVAGMSFGFWSGMLGKQYEDLWRAAIRHAFPGGDGTRKQAAVLVEAVRKFRNRLAHHDSMLGLDIPFEIRRVHALAGLIGPDVAAWIRSVDHTSEVYAQRPVALVDTVVVGAQYAWPFYQAHYAYVCQPGRWFRPVDRFAFYAEREVKPEVPRIMHRRDYVAWTEEAAATLAGSSDRFDRKVAEVIRASRQDGWTGGSYQVFLLSRPGAPEHRTLNHSIPNPNTGKGSAYVQGQRYVSLHTLETATTTNDLRSAATA